MEEKEVKFLDIDPVTIEQKIFQLGGNKVFEKTYRRKVFDYPDLRLDKEGAWVRLRDEGDKITLTFKHRLGSTSNDGTTNDTGMEEIEVVVSDFGKMADLLIKIGFVEKHYVENNRTRYLVGDVELDIDSYPRLKPFLEIEASSWEKIDRMIELLKLNPADKKIFSTSQIYRLNGIEIGDYSRITFAEMVKK